ncbi:hypothetical protein Srot_0084 [Segniliparus rotundus DSM 44985]|uniref:Uncharacterized protein n=1 Tax=Segniliparus rotundus (strain ATCC BAA-972 / CDC 1076 / CIP 108378 / DSM 44985 / JCM 13578) TaxID=640132 RepID=D6Z9P9_SEGRD|nr:hypothetical protein [Segniliparus rotundus]ADG96576.1 hypothetical protein Srot_0084 [Segniliparus rotundus DSM 44985]
MRWPWQLRESVEFDGEDLDRRVREAQHAKDRADKLREEAAPLVALARRQRRENGFGAAVERTMRRRHA